MALSLETFTSLDFWIMVVMAAFGLGLVIFVHELGHFAVAKWCGVKCEKFYLGFDIGGLKLAKFQWGETEYGIGVLPLGGYVKMLGQDDNPTHAAQEAERARLQSVPGGAPAPEPVGDETPAEFDPRSYMAQSVPKRMAIISAGVIMNVLFAFVAATLAFGMGVRYIPSVVSETVPGEAAWEADIRPGDEAVRINNIEKPRFDMDLMSSVVLSNLQRGVELELKRPGQEDTFTVNLKPRKDPGDERPTVGIALPLTAQLSLVAPARPDAPAAAAKELKPGDVVHAVNGQPIAAYHELLRYFAQHSAEPVELTVVRPKDKADPFSVVDPHTLEGEELTVEIGPNPLRTFGLEMEMGPIVGVQAKSPAAGKLQDGDRIVSLGGEPVGDPMTLSQRVQMLGQEEITLTVERPGQDAPVEVSLVPRQPEWFTTQPRSGTAVEVPALGIAYEVGSKVAAVAPGSAAEKQGLKAGDRVTRVEFVPADKKKEEAFAERYGYPDSIDLVDEGQELNNWAFAFYRLQNSLAGTKVKLQLADGRSVSIAPDTSEELFNPDRGLNFNVMRRERQAESLGEAVALGLRQTKEFLLQVYGFIQKLATRQISTRLLGGPITIAQAAGASFTAGVPQFLIVLAMISANLAVINFLPIPVLDGGHMVFLTLEGLRGKPVSERVVVAFHYAGLCFILALMIFVITLDVQRIGGG